MLSIHEQAQLRELLDTGQFEGVLDRVIAKLGALPAQCGATF
jgi:hypothetical protein